MTYKWQNRPIRPNSYLQDIPSKDRRIHFLFKCTWNVLQDRSCIEIQANPSKQEKTQKPNILPKSMRKRKIGKAWSQQKERNNKDQRESK